MAGDQIQVFPDLEQLSRAAAEQFASLVRTRESLYVALAGGGTPRRVYEILAEQGFADKIPWTRVHVFWGGREMC